MGVALFSPFDPTRRFGAFTPIAVSPIGGGFFSGRGLVVLRSELLWVWLPSLVFAVAATMFWRLCGRSTQSSDEASA